MYGSDQDCTNNSEFEGPELRATSKDHLLCYDLDLE